MKKTSTTNPPAPPSDSNATFQFNAILRSGDELAIKTLGSGISGIYHHLIPCAPVAPRAKLVLIRPGRKEELSNVPTQRTRKPSREGAV